MVHIHIYAGKKHIKLNNKSNKKILNKFFKEFHFTYAKITNYLLKYMLIVYISDFLWNI